MARLANEYIYNVAALLLLLLLLDASVRRTLCAFVDRRTSRRHTTLHIVIVCVRLPPFSIIHKHPGTHTHPNIYMYIEYVFTQNLLSAWLLCTNEMLINITG